MVLKKLLATFGFALVILLTGCAKDEVVEIVGVCPIVLSTVPDTDAINVPLDQVITVTFNEEVDPETINEDTFTIDGATSVVGTVTSSGATATFTPSADLAPNTTYTGMVTTSVKDPMGNALQENYVWTFTTIPEVTLSATPEAGGTLIGAGTFSDESLVTVAAIPNDGFTFTNWTVGETVVSTSSSYQFEMDGNIALVANFDEVVLGNFRINLSSLPIAGGTTNGSGQFSANATVTVAALPNPGYVFVNWTEGETIASTSSSYQFVLTANRTLVANYSLVLENQFAVILSANPAAGGSTNGSGSFDADENVIVTATPNNGYAFVNWTEGETIASTSSSYTFAITANTNLVANFEVIGYTLNVTAQHGSVSKNPDNLIYNDGDSVELKPTPDSGYEFTSWSGDATGINNPLIVTMNSNKNITANFTAIELPPAGPLAIDLKCAEPYAILAGSTITSDGPTVINGDVGLSAGTALEGFPPGTINGVQEITTPNAAAAKLCLTEAFLDGMNRSVNAISLPGQLGGLTLAPGLYSNSSTSGISGTGTNAILTLDAGGNANAVWIFQMGSTLTTAPGTKIVLAGNAKAKNIFWIVGTSATLGTNSSFSGNILAQTSISLNTGATLLGRALTQDAAVTLLSNIVTKPTN